MQRLFFLYIAHIASVAGIAIFFFYIVNVATTKARVLRCKRTFASLVRHLEKRIKAGFAVVRSVIAFIRYLVAPLKSFTSFAPLKSFTSFAPFKFVASVTAITSFITPVFFVFFLSVASLPIFSQSSASNNSGATETFNSGSEDAVSDTSKSTTISGEGGESIGETQEIEERLTNTSTARAQKKLKKAKKSKAKKSDEGAQNVITGDGEQKLFLPQGDKKLRGSRGSERLNITELVAGVGAFTQKNISEEAGHVKLTAKAKTGAVQLYAVKDNGRAVPVLSNYNYNARSALWVKVGSGPGNILKSRKTHEEVYCLTANPVAVTATRLSGGSVSTVHVLRDNVRVVAKYEAVRPRDMREAPKKVVSNPTNPTNSDKTEEKSSEEVTDAAPLNEEAAPLLKTDDGQVIKECAIKVTLTMENRSRETNVFALKQVLDTRLGEGRKVHFSTNNDKYIASQVRFDNFDWEGKVKVPSSKVIQGVTNWITSTNDKVFMTIVTAGRGISALESATIASVEALNSARWDTPLKAGESFDKAYEWGDSGVCLYWGEKRLAPRQKINFTYYIALAVMDEFDCGQFVDSFTAPLKEGQKFAPPIQINVDLSTDGDFSNGRFVFDESTITGEKINYDYIQTLLDRINEIEASGDIEDNRNELLRLNAEIDIILDKLKK